MLGDILHINETHKAVAKELCAVVLEKRHGRRFIVAISGESGSGKSVVAHSLGLLLKEHGIRSKILHTDNYYSVPPLQRNAWRKKHMDKIGLDEYDWFTLTENITDFCDAKQSVMPCVDILSDQVDRLTTDFGEVEVLIIEGIYAIRAERTDLSIFIDIPYMRTLEAQTSRGKEHLDSFRMHILEEEHRASRQIKEFAHFFITEDFELQPNSHPKTDD